MVNTVQFQRLKSTSYWLLAAGFFLAAGCSFDSSLGEVSCDAEGQMSQGRLCQDGRWVQLPEADASLDTDPIPDILTEDTLQPSDTRAEDVSEVADTVAPKDVADAEDAADVELDIRDASDSGEPDILEDADGGSDADVSDAGSDADAGEDADVGGDADAGSDADAGEDADVGGDADAGSDAGGCAEGARRECIMSGTEPSLVCLPPAIQICAADGSWSECAWDFDSIDCGIGACDRQRCDSINPNMQCRYGACCEPKTVPEMCAFMGRECGKISVDREDNCGQKIDKKRCGQCGDGQTCSDQGVCESDD
ncbi:hypothetical protein [Bradymonas sediminis]|uniref:Uncharacterized protein n=1 Tax=Bradymonas sediminis TaxID=1548548 RepID=A0A2Z4FRC6_9DELT|nr:hypothetical protein [Bradymonas sediminis]AWV91198.1 hypothetical protein DN745_18445 [Bradymonas sediminis]TDP73762.1 hypothetical protein DFR33_10594 [Bradymonas sediminis]